MKKLNPTKLALLIAAVCSSPMVWAQQSSTTDVGRISVEGQPGGTSTGLMVQEETPKARSSVNRAHLDTLNPTANPYQAIEMLPGVSTFSNDPTGLFGGGLRVRGANSDQMGFTINGAPVNDSGNFAVFPQEYTDSENLCEIFVTQGSTDTEAPHVGASGGNVGMTTCPASDKLSGKFTYSFGGLHMGRTYFRADTGKFADNTAKAYISYSIASSDKFKGNGSAKKEHVDFGIEFKPNASWSASSSFLWNKALNNNIRTLTKAQIASGGSDQDFGINPPQHLTPVNGTAQVETVPAGGVGYYDYNVNPFLNMLWTNKIEFKANKDLSFSVEPYYWYGHGTGGSQLQTLKESNATTIVGGGVKDINGDGDTLDTIMVYGSNVTETNRPGVTLKSNIRVGSNDILVGYWYERARHAQTAPRVTFSNDGTPADAWLFNSDKYLLMQNGQAYNGRNQLTISTGSSLFIQDSINMMDDKLNLQLGLRNSEIKREFNNYANAGVGAEADYVYNKTFSKVLPSVGVRYRLDAEQQVFANLAQNMKAPANFVFQNLLQGGSIVNGVRVGATLRDPSVQAETSTNLDVGYRLANDNWTLSGSVFYIDFKDRIASAYDPNTALSTDYNVGQVITQGVELESGYRINAKWNVYGSLSYTDSRMQSDLRTSATNYEATSGKQMPDTPYWMSGMRVGYADGPWYGNMDLKYTGAVYSTLVNDESISDYTTVNLTVGYHFSDALFFKKPTVQLNVSNLFNQGYLRMNSGSGSSFTTRALGTGGSSPAYYVGSPMFTSVTFRTEF